MKEQFIVAMFIGHVATAIALLICLARIDMHNHQAIERGYALYCPTTGDFAWKGECDDD